MVPVVSRGGPGRGFGRPFVAQWVVKGGHFGYNGWPKWLFWCPLVAKVTILVTMGGQSGHFGAHWWPKVAKRVKKGQEKCEGKKNVRKGEKR